MLILFRGWTLRSQLAAAVLLVVVLACEPAAQPTPIPTPVSSPTRAPLATPSSTATSSPTAAPAAVSICNTGGIGAFIRKEPKGPGIIAWPDGARLAIVGPDRNVDGEVWRNLRDDQGNIGWTKADYVCSNPP